LRTWIQGTGKGGQKKSKPRVEIVNSDFSKTTFMGVGPEIMGQDGLAEKFVPQRAGEAKHVDKVPQARGKANYLVNSGDSNVEKKKKVVLQKTLRKKGRCSKRGGGGEPNGALN